MCETWCSPSDGSMTTLEATDAHNKIIKRIYRALCEEAEWEPSRVGLDNAVIALLNIAQRRRTDDVLYGGCEHRVSGRAAIWRRSPLQLRLRLCQTARNQYPVFKEYHHNAQSSGVSTASTLNGTSEKCCEHFPCTLCFRFATRLRHCLLINHQSQTLPPLLTNCESSFSSGQVKSRSKPQCRNGIISLLAQRQVHELSSQASSADVASKT
nr:hypothetical protein CFP56_69097 [Quercus suber]